MTGGIVHRPIYGITLYTYDLKYQKKNAQLRCGKVSTPTSSRVGKLRAHKKSPHYFVCQQKEYFLIPPAGYRTQVARVKAEYPNH